jgi:hypothetical protein
VAKRKSKELIAPLTRRELNDVICDSLEYAALAKMRDHPDGLAAALVYCNALGLPLPEWARDRLAGEQFSTTFSARRRRQKQEHYKMEIFAKDLLRYASVCLYASARKKRNDKMEFAFQEIEGLWFAPQDSSGLKKSYYKFQRMFAGRALSRYVAFSVAAAEMKRKKFVP